MGSLWVRALHAAHHVRPALALDGTRRRRARRASCSSPRSRSSPLPTQFINAGSEKILQVSVAPPSGCELRGRPRAGHRGRDDPRRRRGRRAHPDEHPRRGRHQLPDDHRRPERPAGQQRDDDGPLKPTVDLAEKTAEFCSALEPIKTDGYDVQVSRGRRVHLQRPEHHRQRRGPRAGRDDDRRRRRGPRGRPDLANLQSDLVKATAEIQVTVDPTKAIGVGLTAAQVANEVRTALVAQTVTQVTLEPGQPIDLVVQVDPEVATSVEELQPAPGRHRRPRSRSSRSRPSSRPTSRAASPASTRPPPRRSRPRS